MDTRQLAAFCAVVERRSFSQAAERLGVTQPAVSLQVRALEKRLGTQLLDRSGRRVEPTESGWRLYRGAQRLLALEEQIVSDVALSGEGELTGDLVLGASTGPAAIVVPVLLGDRDRLDRATREAMARRHGEHDLVAEEGLERERAHPATRADDAELELSIGNPLDHGLRGRDGQRHLKRRVPPRELAEEKGHEAASGPRGRPDLEPASKLALIGCKIVEELLLGSEQALGAAVDPQPRLRRLDPPARTVEQALAESLLECPHLEADGGLRDAETLSRLREAPPLDDGAERGELSRIHKHSL